MFNIYSNYCTGLDAVAQLLTIYIEEAHASDEWKLPESTVEVEMATSIAVHQSISERLEAAKLFQVRRNFQSEIVCDSMDGNIVECYDAWPERLYIILNGVIVYKGGIGPFDYKLWEVQEWLFEKFGKRGECLRKLK